MKSLPALLFIVAMLSACPVMAGDTNINKFTITNGGAVMTYEGDVAEKQYLTRVFELDKINDSNAPDHMEKFLDGVRLLIKDYPTRPNGYEDIMELMGDYEFLGKPEMARSLAKEMMTGPAPDHFKQWAKGFLYRLDSLGKPITLKFTAVDGREVDLSKMTGKVVLVDFWGTHCGPCVAELPRVKAALEKFQGQGFEVIGISCDTDKSDLVTYVREKAIPWPQYFDGKQQADNKYTIGFGIDGIPHMFLIDRKGCLRMDNVRASNGGSPKGKATSFEEKISRLLAEK